MAPKGNVPRWATDPLVGAFGAGPAAAMRTAGQYVGGGLQGFLGSEAIKNSPYAALGSLAAPRQAQAGERQGPYVPQRLTQAPLAPVLPAAATSPNTRYEAADEEYKTLLSQYGGAPGISQLAGMASLPTGFTPTGTSKQANLKDYYAAQALQGSANLGSIIKEMGYSGDMAKWAQENPALAQQQYAKRFGAGQPSSPGDRSIGSFIGDVSRYSDQSQATPAGQTSFGNIANPIAPTQAWNQGAMVDASRGKENLIPQQAAKTTPEGTMPQLETTAQPPSTLERVGSFVEKVTPAIRAILGPGGYQGLNY